MNLASNHRLIVWLAAMPVPGTHDDAVLTHASCKVGVPVCVVPQDGRLSTGEWHCYSTRACPDHGALIKCASPGMGVWDADRC